MKALDLSVLYVEDETAWLEESAELIRAGRARELDLANLEEFLDSMARRDRREVRSRLRVLLTHVLKWLCQPEKRTSGWRATVQAQRFELEGLLESKTLHNHAEAILGDVFETAVEIAMAETQLTRTAFPTACPFTVDALLSEPLD